MIGQKFNPSRDTTTFGFDKAIHLLEQGFTVQRLDWKKSGLTVRLLTPTKDNNLYLPLLYIKYSSNIKETSGVEGPWRPSQEDVLAKDWTVFVTESA